MGGRRFVIRIISEIFFMSALQRCDSEERKAMARPLPFKVILQDRFRSCQAGHVAISVALGRRTESVNVNGQQYK